MSKPKEKAVELVNRYLQIYDGRVPQAKQCALIAVDELIKKVKYWTPNIRKRYYEEVKQEIEKL